MISYCITRFGNDIIKGKIGEQIFKEDFLNFLNINYEDVTGRQQFQVIDSDYLTKIGLYEIKTNYKDDEIIIVEEYSNINENLGKIKIGWWYTTKSDLLICVSKNTRTMIFIPLNDNIKNYYESIKEQYELKYNKISEKDGRKWQSAYRKIPLESLKGYFSCYKKIIN